MSLVFALLILISILVALLLGWMAWGFSRSRSLASDNDTVASRGDVLVWLLVLAAFALGAFVSYILIGWSF